MSWQAWLGKLLLCLLLGMIVGALIKGVVSFIAELRYRFGKREGWTRRDIERFKQEHSELDITDALWRGPEESPLRAGSRSPQDENDGARFESELHPDAESWRLHVRKDQE